MRRSIATIGIILCLVLLTSKATAQNRDEDARPAQDQPVVNAEQSEAEHRQMMEQSKQMEEMAKAMTSMAQMCEAMMKMEMQNHPLKVAVVAAGGSLLATVLVLFVVLEIQWIRYFHLRIRQERQRQ